MANLLMPLQIERQYGASLDADYSFDTLEELKNYATTSALSYSGQILYCKGTDTIYKVNTDKTDVSELGGATASDVIVAYTPDEANALQTKENRNKIMFYMGNTKSSYVHGELYYLHWNAITLKKFYTKGGGILEIDYDVLEQKYASYSQTITFKAEYKQDTTNVMNRWFCEYSGGSGSRLDVVGVNISNGSETLGDVIEFTYNSASKNSDNYTWKPLFVKPQRTFEKNWWLVNKIATYGGGYDDEFINGHRYQFTTDININATASGNIVVSLDEEQYKNYFGLHSKSSLTYNADTGCFEYRYGMIHYEDNRFTIEYLNQAGITWTGEIADGDTITITCTMSDDINDYYWKDLEYAVEGDSGNIVTLTQAEYDALSDEEKDSDTVYFIPDAKEEIQNDDSAYMPDVYDRNSNGDVPVVPFDRLADNMFIVQNSNLVKEGETYDEDYVGGYVYGGANDILIKEKEMFNKVKVVVAIPGVVRIGIVNGNIFNANPRYSDCLVKWLVSDFVAYTGFKEYDIENTTLNDGEYIFIECRAGESGWYYNQSSESVKIGDITYPASSCTSGLNVADKLDTTTNNACFKSQSVTSTSARTYFGNNQYTIGNMYRTNFDTRHYTSGQMTPRDQKQQSLYTGGLNVGLYRRTKYSDTRHCKCIENVMSPTFTLLSNSVRIWFSEGQEALEGKSVYAIKLDVHTTGNLTICHCKGTTVDDFQIIDKYTHYVRAKGLQTIHLPFDIKLNKGEYIGLGGFHCKSTADNIVVDTCKWHYASKDEVSNCSWMNTIGKTGFYSVCIDPAQYPEVCTSVSSRNSGYINVELICRGEKKSPLEDKYISFTGDSITTFAGFCTTKTGYPEGNSAGDNAVYYPASGKVVNNIDATWWGILAKDNRMQILRNDAWSGSRVSSSTGSADTKCLCGSQRRYYLRNTYNPTVDTTYPFGNPEIIVNMIGTNDLSGGVELGEGLYYGLSGADDEYKTILGAYSLMCRRFANEYCRAGAKIVHFLIPRGTDCAYNVNGKTIADLSLEFEKIAKAYGQYFIPLSYFSSIYPFKYKAWSCPTASVMRNFTGTAFSNADSLHPNVLGMEIIADGVHRYLNQIV